MRVVVAQPSIEAQSPVAQMALSAWPDAEIENVAFASILRAESFGPLADEDVIIVSEADSDDALPVVRFIAAEHPNAIVIATGSNRGHGRVARDSIMAAGAAAFISFERLTPSLLAALVIAGKSERSRPLAADSTMHRFLWKAQEWPEGNPSAEELAAQRLAKETNSGVVLDDSLSFYAPWSAEDSDRQNDEQIFWLTAPWRDGLGSQEQGRDGSVNIPGYRIIRQLGSGGMSTVWLAEREKDGMELVLKVLAKNLVKNKVQLQRFMREYRLIANINSKNVVRIYDQGTVGNLAYIAMEYFPGGDLRQRLGDPLSPGRALKLLWGIARALHSIHARGIVHRDLKPANIMYRADGSPALVDFGVSRRGSVKHGTSDLTLTGELLGTPLYMSPEQGRGGRATPQSDLYSLGVIFYEMLAGEYPFTDKSLMVIIHRHAVDPIPRLPKALANYQEMLDTLLAKDPKDRFKSARGLLHYIKQRWGEKAPSSKFEGGKKSRRKT
jgi:hypothetical protein